MVSNLFKIKFTKTGLYFLAHLIIFLLTIFLAPQSSLCQVENQSFTKNLKKVFSDSTSFSKLIPDSISLKEIRLGGQINANFNQLIQYQQKPVSNYTISCNLNLRYKRLNIPFSYTYSNGRSISRISGPPLRTPKFTVLGLSPTIGATIFHLGNRTMDFSKYAFQGIRFNGVGMELPENGFYVKLFSGNLSYLDPRWFFFNTPEYSTFPRKARGLKLGYSSSKIKLGVSVLRIRDQYQITLDSLTNQTPKENSVIDLEGQYKIKKKLSLNFEYALSALTKNAFDKRIEIPTHQSLYNMLGLFEKKPSSIYRSAFNFGTSYELSKHKLSFDLERVEKGFQSLGTLFFDQNFLDLKTSISGTPKDFISYSFEIGQRQLLETNQENGDRFFLLTANANLKMNENLQTNFSVSNNRTVTNSLFQSPTSLDVDSLLLTQSNFNASMQTTYQFQDSSNSSLSLGLVKQSGVAIRNDALSENKTDVTNINLAYQWTNGNHNYYLGLNSSFTQSNGLSNKVISLSGSYNSTLSSQLNLSTNTNFSIVFFRNKRIQQLSLSGNAAYRLTKSLGVNTSLQLNFLDQSSGLRFNTLQINSSCTYQF